MKIVITLEVESEPVATDRKDRYANSVEIAHWVTHELFGLGVSHEVIGIDNSARGYLVIRKSAVLIEEKV